MDLVYILRELWLRRLWVALGLLLGCAVGLAVAYDFPSFSKRSVEHGVARTQVLVDTTPSTLADTGSDYEPLITRAGVYAQLFAFDPVKRRVAADTGIPTDRIETDAPSSGQSVTADDTAPGREAGPVQRSSQIAAEASPYRLSVDVERELPIISIFAQAPDKAAAARLADGAATGLQKYIATLSPTSAEGRSVAVRVLGDASTRTVGQGTNTQAAVLSGAAVFIVWCLLVLAFSNVSRRWRLTSSSLLPSGRWGDDRPDAPEADRASGPPADPPRDRAPGAR